MKTRFALLLCLLLACVSLAAFAEDNGRTVASYQYALTEEGAYVENLIFNEDVIISGDNTQILFVNCEFNGDVILTANEGTRVLLMGCDVNGACILRNDVKEGSMDYPLPKFLVDTPITSICEDCVGAVIALGDFEIVFNGETYTQATSELFSDARAPEAGFVPYEGQDASYFYVGQWYENDQKVLFLFAEYDPAM